MSQVTLVYRWECNETWCESTGGELKVFSLKEMPTPWFVAFKLMFEVTSTCFKRFCFVNLYCIFE